MALGMGMCKDRKAPHMVNASYAWRNIYKEENPGTNYSTVLIQYGMYVSTANVAGDWPVAILPP